MTVSIKHTFISAKGDGSDATLVRPSAWNAAHTTSMNSSSLVGRLSAGIGAFEEIPITANGAAILAAADSSSFGFTTGDVKFSISNVPPAGWINAYGSIGNATSGASTRANADVLPLYSLLYAYIADAYLPVSGGRTGNALNDFNAGKTMVLSPFAGRAIANATGTFPIGYLFGEATHTLTQAELPAAPLSVSVSGSATVVSTNGTWFNGNGVNGIQNPGAGSAFVVSGSGSFLSSVTSTGSISGSGGTSNMGSGAAHNNYQPSIALCLWMKL